jgi:hypothetical protein
MPAEIKSLPYGEIRTGKLLYYTPTYSEVTRSALVGEEKSLTGVVGERDVVNPLLIISRKKVIPLLVGSLLTSGGAVSRTFDRFPIGNHNSVHRDPSIDTGSMSNAKLIEYAWEILAKTNPSRPHVSVPTVLAELRELPQLVRGYGQSLIRSAASANLSWRWAVKPMISDVQKLLQFAKASNERLNELRNLRDGKMLRKRCHLDTQVVTHPKTRLSCHSEGGAVYCQRQYVTSWNTWGSAEWKVLPDSVLPKLDDRGLQALADRVAAGITSHGALETAWELMPWSWLVDWFSNVGTMIQATNNTVGCTWNRIAVMRRSLCRTTFEVDPIGTATWISFQGWYDCHVERKERWRTYPAIPFPLPSLPVIDNGKWSILLSLAALKR